MKQQNPNLGQAQETSSLAKLRVNDQISADEHEARLAMARIEQLRGKLSGEHGIFRFLNYEDLVRSRELRSLVLDFNMKLFGKDPKPIGSFEREYADERAKEIAMSQSFRQSSAYKEMVKQREEIQPHNIQMLDEYRQEEKGLEASEEKFDEEAFNKQVKA